MSLFKRQVDLKIIPQDDGAIVFDKTRGIYFQTNNVGVFILSKLSEQKKEREIIDLVAEEFGIEKTQSEADVKDFMSSLREAGIA